MNRREKILGAAVAALVLGFAADQWAVEPGLAWYRSVQAETASNRDKVAEAQLLLDHRRQIVSDWRARHKAGLLEDENGARFGAQQALSAAARAGGFSVESFGGGQRVPAVAGQSYDLLRLTLSGQGSLAQVQDFLAAIQQAPLPLRIERCEMSARDGRKDRLDLALTLSLRIASQAAREKIAVPANTVAWRPSARTTTLDAYILKAKPFLSDRHADDAPAPKAAQATKGPAPDAPAPGADWTLVGLVERDGVGEAFLLHTPDGLESVVHAGDKAADGLVKAVDAAGLRIVYDGKERLIQPGSTLAGSEAAPVAGRPAQTASSAASRTGAPAAAPAPTPVAQPSDAEREAILKRLREQRNRTSP